MLSRALLQYYSHLHISECSKHKQLNPLDGDEDFLEDSNGFLDDEGNPSIKITMEWRTEWRTLENYIYIRAERVFLREDDN